MKRPNLVFWTTGIGPLGLMLGAGIAPHLTKILLVLIAITALFIAWAFFAAQFFATLLVLAAFFLFYVGYKTQEKEKSSELSAKAFVPYVIAVLLLLVAFLPLVLAINPPDFTTTSVMFPSNGWDPPHPGFNGEILNGQFYISAIALGARSETLVASVTGVDGGGFGDVTGDNIGAYEYRWYFTTSVFGWGSPVFVDNHDKFPGGADICAPVGTGRRCDFAPSQFYVTGPQVGWVKVVFVAFFIVWSGTETKEIASDDAYIYPGDIANFKWQRPQYAIGETAVLDYSVGYASNPHPEDPGSAKGQGWWLSVTCAASGTELLNQTIENPPIGQTRRTGQAKVTITATCFKTSPPDQACAANEISAVMYSTFWKAGERIATVVDDKGLAPTATMTVTSDGKFEIGDQITAKITATPNPTTGLSIKEYRFVISPPLGDATTVIQASNTYTFSASQEGTYVVQGYAIDLGCRGSPVATQTVTIIEGGGGTGPPDEEFPLWFIIGTFILILLVIITWLVPIEVLKDKDFPWKKVTITVIGIVIYIIVFFGTIAGLVTSGGA